MRNEDRFVVAVWVAAVALLVGFVALLIGVLHKPDLLVASKLLVGILQFLLAIVGLALSVGIVSVVLKGVIERIDQLERDHASLLNEVRRGTPVVITLVLFILDATLAVTGGLFAEKQSEGIIASLAILIFLGAAARLFEANSRTCRAIGRVIWYIGIIVPFALLLSTQQWNLQLVLQEIGKLSASARIASGLVLLLGMVAPLLHWLLERSQHLRAG